MEITARKNFQAALLMMLGITLLSSNDVIMKLNSEELGIGQLLFIRGLIAVVIFSLTIRLTGKPIIAEVAFSKLILLRAFC
jgi:hypothetical protein